MTFARVKKLTEGEDPHSAELALLDGMLKEHFGSALSEQEIIRGKNGKPCFRSGFPHFNFTNCRGYAAAAISDSPVGIDMEGRRRISDKVCVRFLHRLPSGDEERIIAWTEYESLGKMQGVGIPHDLSYAEAVFSRSVRDNVTVTVCSLRDKCVFEWS